MAEQDRDRTSTIEASSFTPSATVTEARRFPVSRWQMVAIAVALVVLWIFWFLFTARSVRFETVPVDAFVVVDGGFEFGETHLLRTGPYPIKATAPGYHDLEQTVDIGDARNQTYPLTLEKLPGIVHFDIVPEGTGIQVGDMRGTAPLTADVPAGPQTILLSHPRYQSQSVPIDVAGRREEQSVAVELRPNWADVRIPTVPGAATLEIDGEPVAETTPGPFEILAGERRLTIKKPGFQPWVDILDFEAEASVELPRVDLLPAGGKLTLRSQPDGAGVTINGQYQGETPLQVEVAPGPLNLRFFKVGFSPESRAINLDSGQERTLRVALEQQTGELSVETQPGDAELWIDGERQGVGKQLVTLTAVAHDVEIRREGYAAYKRSFLPQPGFRQELKVRLLTLEEARLAALKSVRTTAAGQELVLLSPTEVKLGASRREPGRRANEVLRDVELTRLFYLSRTEVSNREFRQFAPGHESGEFEGLDLNDEDQPVVGITWNEAAQYCNWLSLQDKLDPFYEEEFGKIVGFNPRAKGYRLPSEAEWSWAILNESRPTRFPWGDDFPPPDRHGNYADRAAQNTVGRIIFGYNDNYIAAAPVGTFSPNQHGVYDLGGNVAEWVHDFYEIPDSDPATDPMGPNEGDFHVIKGSSWKHGTVTDLRNSFRDYGKDGRQDLGFRIARFAE